MAGAAISASALLPSEGKASTPTRGDVAILRFLAAAELIEADLWQQYAELGGVSTGAQNNYQLALQNLDSDGSQYISSNTLDEKSHADFLNAYLTSLGEEPVDLDRFRTLPSSTAAGARQIGRLTNLMKLSVDTSWYVRYRSVTNPDFGATFPQALPALFAGKFPAIPRTNADFSPPAHIQAIANTAAFHFGFIEQGGSSLYATLSQQVSSAQVLKITLSIGGDEIAHFLEWTDFSGNGVSPPVAPLTDPTNGLTFPNFDAPPNASDELDLPRPVRIHQPQPTTLRGDPADVAKSDKCGGGRKRFHCRWAFHRPVDSVCAISARSGTEGGRGYSQVLMWNSAEAQVLMWNSAEAQAAVPGADHLSNVFSGRLCKSLDSTELK